MISSTILSPASIASLMVQGGQNFVIVNLPDLSKIPYAKKNQLTDRLHLLSEMHNQKLADKIKELKNSINPDSNREMYQVS